MPIYFIGEFPLDTSLGSVAHTPEGQPWRSDYSEKVGLPNVGNVFLEFRVPQERTAEQQRILSSVVDFVTPISTEFVAEFQKLLDESSPDDTGVQPSNKIRQRLRKHDFLSPRFLFAQGHYASQLHARFSKIAKAPLASLRTPENSNMLVFQLPPPLAHWWYEGGVNLWGTRAVDATGVIPWGYFYRKLMPIIWDGIELDSKYGLSLYYLNPVGVHDPNEFYYLWEVTSD